MENKSTTTNALTVENELLTMVEGPTLVEDILVVMVATTMVPMEMAATMVVEFPTTGDIATLVEAKPMVAEAVVVVVMLATTVDKDFKAVISSKDVDIKATVVAMVIKDVAMAMVISKAEETTRTKVEVITKTVDVVPTTTTTTMADSNSKAMEVVSSTMTVIIMSPFNSHMHNSSNSNKTSIGLILETTMDTLIKVTIELLMTPTVLTFLASGFCACSLFLCSIFFLFSMLLHS